MRNQPFELWLIWQNVETRQRYHVGSLAYHDNTYKFSYEVTGERRKLNEALKNGYQPHLAFPKIDKVYTSQNLFGPFARRLPDSRRPDYAEVLQSLGLPSDCTEMDVLRATGGILATDSYELVSPILVDHTTFDFDFFVAGLRYYEGEKKLSNLQVGDEVKLRLDPDNVQDHRAVEVLMKSGEKLGFIPAFYSGWMYEIIDKESCYEAKVEEINPFAVSHRQLSIVIAGEVSPAVDIQEVLDDKEKLRLVLC